MKERADLPDEVSANTEQPELPGPAPHFQWAGMFLAPAAFLLHLQCNYLLVMYICGTTKGRAVIYTAAIIAVLVAAGGVLAAWVTWTKAGDEAPGDGPGPFPRARMLGAVGMGVSAIALLVLLAQLTAAILGPTCE